MLGRGDRGRRVSGRQGGVETQEHPSRPAQPPQDPRSSTSWDSTPSHLGLNTLTSRLISLPAVHHPLSAAYTPHTWASTPFSPGLGNLIPYALHV